MSTSLVRAARTSGQFVYQEAIKTGTYKTPKAMKSLIRGATKSSDRGTKELAKHILGARTFKITAQKHVEGFGGQGRGPDPRPHYTVRSQGKNNLTVHIYTKTKGGREFISGIKC